MLKAIENETMKYRVNVLSGFKHCSYHYNFNCNIIDVCNVLLLHWGIASMSDYVAPCTNICAAELCNILDCWKCFFQTLLNYSPGTEAHYVTTLQDRGGINTGFRSSQVQFRSSDIQWDSECLLLWLAY